jgi:hypothetical protein
MSHDDTPVPPRRQALAQLMAGALAAGAVPAFGSSAGAGAASGAARALQPRQWTSSFLSFDHVERFRQAWRIQRSLADQADILHWYHFIMVAVPVGSAPRPVVRWEGIEFSRHERIGENRFRLHGHNLSFPRDLRSGEFVSEVTNPVTGKRVAVPPMALTGDPGMIRSPDGVVTLDKPKAPPRPDYRILRREGEFVKVDTIRVPPETWPVTFLEMGYESTPAALFDDPKQLWLPSDVSGAYVFPWPAWMQMGDAPGHMFAAWSGYKLRDIGELPPEFRQRAERDFPELLAVDRKAFAKSIDLDSA